MKIQMSNRNILIAVTGGIAAYKIPSVVSVLVDKAYDVKVMMTKAAEQFITPLTLSAMSHNPVYTDDMRYANDGHIHHIELAEWADTIAVAPATFNTISKIRQNLADNLVTSTIAAFSFPHRENPESLRKILIFPAMNVNMWKNLIHESGDYTHRIFTDRRGTFNDRGVIIYEPASGKQACGAVGPGKLLPTKEIVQLIEKNT